MVLGAWCLVPGAIIWYNFNNERRKQMSNEPNKPIEAEELTEKELEGIVGGMEAYAHAEAKGKEGLVRIAKKYSEKPQPEFPVD